MKARFFFKIKFFVMNGDKKMAKNQKDYNQFAGNRYSLRAKTYHMIKRVDFISNRLKTLGDLLVTTWLGLILAVLVLAGGGLLIGKAIFSNNMATAIQNIPAIILFLIGTILICINVMMTNPSMGIQIVVSTKFIIKKLRGQQTSGINVDLRPFRFTEDITNKSVVETVLDKEPKYLAMYRVKGTVSPVTFQNELNKLASLNHQLLANLERDTILTTINSVQSSKVELKELPTNATPAMKRKRDINYMVTSNLKFNQQLDTLVVLACPNLDVLRSRMEALETVFRRGLVIGWYQLVDEELKKEFNTVYG